MRRWGCPSGPPASARAPALIYSELAKSLAADGHFHVRGGGWPIWTYGPLYPVLIAPAYRLFASVPQAYVAIKAIDAVVMSSAAVPAYLLARRVLGRRPSLLVAMLMLAGLAALVGLDVARAPLWVLAAAAAALAFGAMGAAIGALTRDVRAASLLAFMVSLPVAFLALVPSGAVSAGLYEVTRVVSALFPFGAALGALRAALDGSGELLGSLLHLLVLTLVMGAAARLGLRRFG